MLFYAVGRTDFTSTIEIQSTGKTLLHGVDVLTKVNAGSLDNGGFFVKTTVQYLDELRVKLDLPSDYAAAKVLCVTRAAVSKWRQGRTTFDDLTACRVADALGIDPMEVIAAANFERSNDLRSKAVWESMWGKAAGAIASSLMLAVVGLSVAPETRALERADNGRAGDNVCSLYVMSSYRRKQRRTPVSGLSLAA